MKILQVSSLFPPHIGGIEHHVWSLSKRLAEEGQDVTVYTSNVPKSKKYEVVSGIKIHRFYSLFSPLNNQITPGLFYKLIKENEFDLIHVHSHLHLSTNITVFSNIFSKKPIVLTSHGTVTYLDWKKFINSFYNRTFAKWVLKSADKIIALTSKQADILENLGANRDNITIIPNWIDFNTINSNTNIERFIELHQLQNKKIILFVGGLISRKGINYLIDAMKYIESDSILLIAGGEIQGHLNVKNLLEKQAKNLGLKNVIFLGRLSKENLECAYTIADVFVLPSLSEGLSLTLLEAMAYGKCVIATDIPGNSDVIQNGKNGILFSTGNSLELAEKIDCLMSNEELRNKMGTAARIEIDKNYNLDNAYNKILEIYTNIRK